MFEKDFQAVPVQQRLGHWQGSLIFNSSSHRFRPEHGSRVGEKAIAGPSDLQKESVSCSFPRRTPTFFTKKKGLRLALQGVSSPENWSIVKHHLQVLEIWVSTGQTFQNGWFIPSKNCLEPGRDGSTWASPARSWRLIPCEPEGLGELAELWGFGWTFLEWMPQKAYFQRITKQSTFRKCPSSSRETL